MTSSLDHPQAYRLYDHQREFIVRRPRHDVLVWGTGTGKTIAALVWLYSWGEPGYVVCPKSVAVKWRRAAEEWGVDCKVMTKEEFRRDWEKLEGRPIVFDEAHYFSGHTSLMHKAAAKYVRRHKAPCLLMTATPYLSSPLNIFALGAILGYQGYYWSYPYFMAEFFTTAWFGARQVPVVRKDAKEKVAALVRKKWSVVALEECADVPPLVEEVELFQLTAEQRKLSAAVSDPNPVVKWTKRHQICGGGLKGDEFAPTAYCSSDKRERALDIAMGTRKLVVVCRYRHEVEDLAKRLEALGKQTWRIEGSVSTEDRQRFLDEADAAEDGCIVANAACSEGWEAKTFPVLVFYSLDFSLKSYIQMRGRIQRIDALHRCTYIHMVVSGTVDEAVYESMMNKKDFDLAIYNKSVVG